MNRHPGALAALFLAAGLLATGTAAAGKCKRVRGEDVSASLPPAECFSPVGVCLAGEIDANRGLNGATTFTASALSSISGEPGTTFSVSGEATITTDRGTLTLRDVGVFDTVLGALASVQEVTAGTGRFAGVSGVLFLGTQVTPDGRFVSKIDGRLCFPR